MEPIRMDKQILSNLRSLGVVNLTLDEYTPGDGNCFYRAIDQQLRRSDINCQYAGGHSHMRREVVKFVRNNQDSVQYVRDYKRLYETSLRGDAALSWYEYLDKQERDGEYTEELFVKATAVLIGFNIFITNENCTTARKFFVISRTWENTVEITPPESFLHHIVIGSLAGRLEHFQSLLPVHPMLTESPTSVVHRDICAPTKSCPKKQSSLAHFGGDHDYCKIEDTHDYCEITPINNELHAGPWDHDYCQMRLVNESELANCTSRSFPHQSPFELESSISSEDILSWETESESFQESLTSSMGTMQWDNSDWSGSIQSNLESDSLTAVDHDQSNHSTVGFLPSLIEENQSNMPKEVHERTGILSMGNDSDMDCSQLNFPKLPRPHFRERTNVVDKKQCTILRSAI